MTKINFGKRYENASLSQLRFPNEKNELILRWTKKPDEKKGILLILGSPGTGKTYLSAALVNYLQEKNKNFRYYTDSDFIKVLKETMLKGWDTKIEIERLSDSADIFILDDVGSIRLTEWEVEQIHCLIDTRYKNQLPLIIISNFTKKEFEEKFEKRTVSRLFSLENTQIELSGPDLRQQGL